MGHPSGVYNTAYESTFAGERTNVLLRFAGEMGGLYFDTGDLSERAQGWSTFMADGHGQYDCNGGIPKTLIQFLCYSFILEHSEFKEIITQILNRPITPELVPMEEGKVQRSEDTLGDYTLIDFFIFYFLQYYDVTTIYYLACAAFSVENNTDACDKVFDCNYIRDILEKFIRRFYSSQYKRTLCSPGPLIGNISLGSREVWRFADNANSEWHCAIVKALPVNINIELA
jgi:NAD+ synthase (glutamine-hydrolysing)